MNRFKKNCLFCGVEEPNSLEHVIPESLGNDDLVLRNEVCWVCNNHFAKIESYVLQKTEFAFWRAFLGIRTKKGNLPSVDLSQDRGRKGIYPGIHHQHDNGLGFTFHGDGSCSVEISDDSIVRDILSAERKQFQFVITPKVLEQLGRFLCKIGIELICSLHPARARSDIFQNARNYARFGAKKDLWPIFQYSSGSINDLRRLRDNEYEEIDCYEYSLFEVGGEYTLLRLKVGTNNWVVCLNDQWPTPKLKAAFPEVDLQLIWYPRESFRNLSSQ